MRSKINFISEIIRPMSCLCKLTCSQCELLFFHLFFKSHLKKTVKVDIQTFKKHYGFFKRKQNSGNDQLKAC